jgi:rare lipoprotein A
LCALFFVACAQSPPLRSEISVMSRPAPTGSFVEEGKASWYGNHEDGGPTASGERMDRHALTAAHRTLRMNSRVRVTNLANGRQVIVRINDRGPYSKHRVIDLSEAAAQQLGMIERGIADVRIEVLEGGTR